MSLVTFFFWARITRIRGKDKENPYNPRNPRLKESYTTD